MNKLKDWSNIEDLHNYVIEENNHGYSGRLVDKNNKTINILGMPADMIGFSYDKEITEQITQKEFSHAKQIINS